MEKLKLILPVQNGVQIKILPGNIFSVPTFKELDSHNEKVTIERRRGKLEEAII